MSFKSPSRAATTLLIGTSLLVATTIFAQKLSAEKAADETTTKLVCEMLARFHISQSSIGDETSAKLLDRFVERLDPLSSQKLYFLQSDIDDLSKYKSELDDLVKIGNVDFAYMAFNLHLKRLEKRIQVAHRLIDAKHDFTLDETMVLDVDELDWAKSEAELDVRWRQRIKYQLLNLKLDDVSLEEARNRLHKRYRTKSLMAHQTDDAEKLERYLSALTHTFDPHSSYMSPETLEDFRIQMELQLEGIGAALRGEDGYTVVVQIVPGGAADKDGRLKSDDKIIGVGQKEGDIVDVVEMKLSKVVRLIRGNKGTIVRLQVKPGDGGETTVYTLTRQKIELKSSAVKGEVIETAERLNGRQARIGVVNIPSFYRNFRGAQRGDKNFRSTSRDVHNVLQSFDDQGGVDGLIVDLRFNGGGSLSESIEVSGLFIDRGPVVQVKEQTGRVKPYDDKNAGVTYSGPLVVLCNRLSASASEIFAGVIQDYRRGIVVGDTTTHGKGTVQNVMPVLRPRFFQLLDSKDRGALKVTINQFYRVNGESTQNRGVESDVVLPSVLDHMDLGESFLDNALDFDKIQPAAYTTVEQVSAEMIKTLQQSSKRRIGADPKFQETLKEVQRYLVLKKRKTITLNEEQLRKERNQGKKKEQDKKKDAKDEENKSDENGNGPIFPDSHYTNEVLNISLDYFKLLKQEDATEQ